ncbi:hypothetical protein GGR50DRAFT_383214 [Xylaria sp. CBS 124048]|nr:hypothetical protein GGR50DRAFT_383214 [Xylaria sp. CBS 124048]
MATEKADTLGLKPHHVGSPGCEIDTPNFSTTMPKSLTPSECYQKSKDRLSDQHQYAGSHNEMDLMKRPDQPKFGPFISRPVLEDPVDFQVDFKYTKAPTPQTFPFRPNAPRTSLNGSPTSNRVQIGRPFRDMGHYQSNEALGGLKDVQQTEKPICEEKSETERKKCHAGSIHSDPISEDSMPENSQSEKGEPGASRKGQLTGPPFQNSPLFSKISSPLRPKDPVQSPLTKLEKPKLSKAFADIQRKAIIQSVRMNQPSHSELLPISQANPGSPCRFDEPREVHRTGVRQDREQSTGALVRDRLPKTPEVRTSAHNSRHKATATAHPPTHGVHKSNSVRKRPESRTSNISMPRAPRTRERSHTRRKKTSPTLEESYALRNGLSQCWNRFFSYEETRNRHWAEKMEDMVEQLAERDARLADYLAEIRMKDQTITDLKAAKEEQDALCQEQEAALAETKKHHQKLQGKMKEYRDRLNDATNEQQTIFKYFQPRYHQLRDQLRQEERDHKLALEQALAAADEVRAKVQKNVEEVQMLSQQEIRILKQETETLRTKLAEREKDLEREKEHIDDLRRELAESHELNRDAIKSLSVNNQELLQRSDERNIQAQSVAQSVNQQGQKIESVLKLLEDNKATMPSNADLAEDLKILHAEALNSIISALEEYTVSGRELSLKNAEDLKSDISAIRESCANLSSQIQGSNSASDWQQKFGRVQLDYQVLLRETDRLKKKLTEMRDEARIQLEKHEALQRELAALRDTAKTADESDKRAESLEKARQEIQNSLTEKEMRIRGLEEMIKGANKALNDQNQLLRDKEGQLYSEREKHAREVISCHKKQEEAIQQTKLEESAKFQTEYSDIEKRLQNTEQECNRLQNELEVAKQNADTAHKSKKEGDEKEMQVLQSIARLIEEISKDLQVSEQAKRDLNEKLEVWSNDRAETSLLKETVQKLAADQREAIENSKQLGEFLDVQKMLNDTWQRHGLEFGAQSKQSNSVGRERAGRVESHDEQEPVASPDMNRRVTIQSPKISEIYDEIVPISIEDERNIRRQATTPKGIIKPGIPKTWEQPEEQHQTPHTVSTKQTEGSSKNWVPTRDAKPFLVSQSAYNRRVSGVSAVVEESAEELIFGTATYSNETSSMPPKRKRAETKADQRENIKKWEESHPTEKKRSKLSRSMSQYFHDAVPAEPSTESPQLLPLKGAPIERRPRAFVTYGS